MIFYITFGNKHPWKNQYIKVTNLDIKNYTMFFYHNPLPGFSTIQLLGFIVSRLTKSLYNDNYSAIYNEHEWDESFFPGGCRREYNILDFHFLFKEENPDDLLG